MTQVRKYASATPGKYLIQCFTPRGKKPNTFSETSTLQQALRIVLEYMECRHIYNGIHVTHETQLGETFFSFYLGKDKKWYMEE